MPESMRTYMAERPDAQPGRSFPVPRSGSSAAALRAHAPGRPAARAARSRPGGATTRRARSGGPTGPSATPSGRRRLGARGVLLVHAEVVLHVLHSEDVLAEVLDHALGVPAVDIAAQDDLALLDGHLHVGRVDVRVLHQLFADLLAQPLIRTGIALRAL